MSNASSGKTSNNTDGSETTGFVLGALGQKIVFTVSNNAVGNTVIKFKLGGKELTLTQVQKLMVLVSPQEIEALMEQTKKRMEADAMIENIRTGHEMSAGDLALFIQQNSDIVMKLGSNGAKLHSMHVNGARRPSSFASCAL